MKERISTLIKTLESKYSTSGDSSFMLSSSGLKRYELHPIEKTNFNTFSPYDAEKKFNTAAADSGSLLIYETPGWSIGYYKMSFRLFEICLKGKTCNTIQTRKAFKEDFVLIVNGEGTNKDNVMYKKPGKDAETALNEFRSQREVEFVLEHCKTLNKEDLLLLDGSLDHENSKIIEKHPNVLGLSKKTGLSIAGHSAPSFFALKATEHNVPEKPWFYHPLVKRSQADSTTNPEIIFGTLKPNSVVFRIDFPNSAKKDSIAQKMKQLGVCSLDAKYRSYPYPLGAVHSDSVMRKNTKELVKRFIKRELNEYKAGSARDVFALIEKDILHADWYDNLRRCS
ncbi:MAG: hypothetical protein ABIG20_03825 [archaeon]